MSNFWDFVKRETTDSGKESSNSAADAKMVECKDGFLGRKCRGTR